MNIPLEYKSPHVFIKAKRFYSFLLENHRDDVEQVAALVKLLVPENNKIDSLKYADRELYRLARELGYFKVYEETGCWRKVL